MISWILGLIIAIWCLIKRFKKDGRVSGYPLGMPRGTVRAYIAIIVVAFPFNYLIVNQEIPRVVTSAIFILVAFYFETRKTKREKLSILIHEVKHPEKAEEEKRKEQTAYFRDILFLRKELRESLIDKLEERQKTDLLLDQKEELPCNQYPDPM